MGRWDKDGLTRDAAEKAVHSLRSRATSLESVLSGDTVQRGAALRRKNAGLYYDMHRGEELLRDFEHNKARHLMTRGLAANITTNQYPTLQDAIDKLATFAPKDDIVREYMLWRHSLHFSPPHAWQHPDIAPHIAEHGLKRIPTTVNDALAMDKHLGDTFGDLTRSPQAIRIDAYEDHPAAPIRWLNSPQGDIYSARGADQERNRRALISAMSRSLVDRHLEPARLRFNDWMQERAANGVEDTSTASRAAGDHLQLDHRGIPGDYRAEFAHALANGVLAEPSRDPQSAHAPSNHVIDAAARLVGVKPKMDPEHFRHGPRGSV